MVLEMVSHVLKWFWIVPDMALDPSFLSIDVLCLLQFLLVA
jgi:hypothetical protein